MLVLTAVIAVPMTQVQWNGTEASTQADSIDTLLNVMIVLSSFVFSIVLVMLGYSLWKYRAKPGDESDGEPIHGNTKLEIAWTVIPTVIVLFGAVYSAIVLAHIEKQAPNEMNVWVVAQQYKWSFAYEGPGGQAIHSDVLNVPVDREIDFHLSALDVIHSFWVPEWRIKRDLVPAGASGNHVDNTVVVTPDRLGTYNVVCTELCGFGHATMRALVKVVTPEQYASWLKKQPLVKPVAGTSTGSATSAPSQDNNGGTATPPATTSTTGGA